MAKNSIFSGSLFEKLISKFVPQEENDARLSVNGAVVVKTQTPDGKQWVDADANIYPEEILADFPVFTIAKSVDQVKVGDIVKLTASTYATVSSIDGGKVETLSFGGQHRQAKAFKDMFLGQATVRVVVNPLAGLGDANALGGNPLMLLSLLDKESEDKNDLMKTMMLMSCLNGQGINLGAAFQNPMALMMLMKGDGGSVQDILMMQALQNGGLAGIFGAPAAPAAPQA